MPVSRLQIRSAKFRQDDLHFEASMIRSFKHAAFLGLVLVAFLGGCDTPATRPVFPDIRFTNLPRLQLEVASVEIKDEFQPTFREPNVEHLFPVTPEHAVENWAKDRLQAVGTSLRARVRIIDASVKEVELPRTQGITGAFTTDQAQRYDANVEVAVEIIDDRGFALRSVSAKAARSQSVKEGITPNDREQAWYDLTKALMNDLNQELEKQMLANFGTYLQRG
jgi:hypothetical protein